MDYLVGAVTAPKRPFAAIVGGSKVSSKIGVIESLLEKCDILLLGGGMIFTFYKAQGLSVGSSLVEEDKLELATTLLAKAKAKGVSILLPSDVVIADKFAPDANSKVCCLTITLVFNYWFLFFTWSLNFFCLDYFRLFQHPASQMAGWDWISDPTPLKHSMKHWTQPKL